MEAYKGIRKMCEKLWDPTDPDCAAAEKYGFKDQIIGLFAECYTYEDFCNWLIDHNLCIADDFRFADVSEASEFETEEELEEARENCLFCNDDYLCMRW